jgi:predicted HTH domain antitoxin
MLVMSALPSIKCLEFKPALDFNMKMFNTSELSSLVDDLVKGATSGQLSLVTKDGEPAFLAVPFTDDMMREGLVASLAVKLFDDDVITLREGAQMARMTLSEFMHACSERGVAVVRYSPGELEMELGNIQRVADRG